MFNKINNYIIEGGKKKINTHVICLHLRFASRLSALNNFFSFLCYRVAMCNFFFPKLYLMLIHGYWRIREKI